jgi:hypothetical protein
MASRTSFRGGQAAVELLALLPVLLAAALLAWQLVAIVRAAEEAQERARAGALAATGPRGGVVTVRSRVPVPAVLPGAEGLVAGAVAAARSP